MSTAQSPGRFAAGQTPNQLHHDNGPAAIVRVDQTAAALELRRRGKSYRYIGEVLGLSTSVATDLINQALEDTVQEPARAVVQLELERIDELQEGLWTAATSGDVAAAGMVLRLMERRARLLGLDRGSTNLQLHASLTSGAKAPELPAGTQLPEYLGDLLRTLQTSGALDLTDPNAIEAVAVPATAPSTSELDDDH